MSDFGHSDTHSLDKSLGGSAAGYGGNLTTSPLVAPIPEASTWAMMILGFLGVGLMGLRKARQNGGTAFRVV